MTGLLLHRVVLDGVVTDVFIEGNRFAAIGPDLHTSPDISERTERTIDAGGTKAITAPFYNAHTHVAMTLLRGYAEDLELDTWLREHIWPAEARLTAHDVYAGTRLAILEMIRTGTVFFNDMYWEQAATARAVTEMGVRADIGLLHIDGPNGEANPRSAASNEALLAMAPELPDRVRITHAPHAPYTVSRARLESIAADAAATGRRIHIHVAETAEEVRQSMATHGKTPVAYLDELGMVGPTSVLAHCVHLTDDDRGIIVERGATIAHMPISNLKLCSGFFDHQRATTAGCRIALGTDGAASNNSLSMFDEMKVAALLAKSQAGSPMAGRDAAMLHAATAGAADAFDIDAGRIEVGRLADAVLLDLRHPAMVADHNLTTNMVYSADGSVVDTVICDGRILMDNRHVPDEEDIIGEALEVSARLARERERS